MAKEIIEIDDRNIDWAEDCKCSDMPLLPENLKTLFLDKLDDFCLNCSEKDRDHYFIIIDGNNVVIIPASQYNK